MIQQTYRLGLDLGANSIGWAALRLDENGQPGGLLDLGVRVYPDGRNPKDGSSLAAQRRGPRAMRRNHDRYLQRRRKLLNALTRFCLMPEDEISRRAVAAVDPYTLRYRALHERLADHELGRVLFHLNQSRGFKSNRKVDRASNEQGGLIKDAAHATLAELQRDGHPTIGSWLAERHANRHSVRVRLAGSGQTAAYPFYPTRDMIEHEFDTVWAAQSGWNQRLTPEMGLALHDIIFHQRDLRKPLVGKCWLEPGEFRAPRALPRAQRFRIAQSVSHLRVVSPGTPERVLTDKERGVLLPLLYRGSDLTLDQVRKKLGLPTETDFNTREEKLSGCATASRLGKKTAAGAEWHDFDLATQDAAVQAILESGNDDEAAETLIALGLSAATAGRAAKALLADGHAAMSVVALAKILPHLEAGSRYSDAVLEAGYRHHSDTRTGEIRDRLPYYGEILGERIGTGTGEPLDDEEKRLGRAPNPTVHVALNELRRVVNDIIDRHGPPAEIVVETLRDLGRSKKQREDYEKQQKQNRDANDRRRASLEEMGLPVNGRNLMLLRLWKEQASDPKNRVCPYTGKLITERMALSAEVEDDHILPWAVTLDDSAANRILVLRDANRAKSRGSPYEAFGSSREWPAILERAQLLPKEKRWRFQPDAMAQFAENGDFLARHLTDSATIARWAVLYLDVLCPGKVWSARGRITDMLRRALGLNPASLLGKGDHRKSRLDHRHHAIDAVVVALTDRSVLQRLTKAAQQADATGNRLLADVDPPWEGFVAQVSDRLASMTVSFKPDTGWQGAMHNDTAYGPIQGAGERGPNVVVRRPLLGLADASDDPKGSKAAVRDPELAQRINAALVNAEATARVGAAGQGKKQIETAVATARKAALSEFRHAGGNIVRRVRMVERLDAVQPIPDRRTGETYKLVKRDGNHCAELWRLPDGSLKLTVVSIFDAARQAEAQRHAKPACVQRPHPGAKLMMRLHKNDLIAFGGDNSRQVMRIVKMSSGNLTLALHSEAGNLKKRDSDKADHFKYISAGASRLKAEKAQKLYVTPAGRIMPGSPPLA